MIFVHLKVAIDPKLELLESSITPAKALTGSDRHVINVVRLKIGMTIAYITTVLICDSCDSSLDPHATP